MPLPCRRLPVSVPWRRSAGWTGRFERAEGGDLRLVAALARLEFRTAVVLTDISELTSDSTLIPSRRPDEIASHDGPLVRGRTRLTEITTAPRKLECGRVLSVGMH